MSSPRYGWIPDPHGVETIQARLAAPVFATAAGDLLRNYPRRDTHLWRPLLELNPAYRRGAQEIGSCVGWGCELACTLLTAKHWMQQGRRREDFREAATEPIYGGSRCEARGRDFAGWSDGSFGAAAAKFVQDFGVLYRRDYGAVTGLDEHDLSRYDSGKEKQWGAYGCGGRHDEGRLDRVAKDHPVRTVSQVRSFDDVAAAIAGAHCPVTIASMYGCSMRRDRYGECGWDRQWPHQMVLIAVRFGQRPAALCAQSWGPASASGPSGDEFTEQLPPSGTPANILGFTWWIAADTVDRICTSGDCWAIGDVDGWRIDPFDWDDLWGKPQRE